MPALPERIVCLTEEPTEVLYALGEEQRIVGISGFTVRPPRARQEKPKVSAFTSAKVDRILALKPDLAIGFSDIQADIAQALIKAGIEVWIANHRSVSEILGYVLRLGAMVGASAIAPTAMWTAAVAHRRSCARSAATLPRRPRVYFEEWDEPAISAIRWVSELIGIAGGDDVFPQRAAASLARDRIVADGGEIVRARARHHHRLVVRQEVQARARGRAQGLCRRAGGARRRTARSQVAADPAARAGRVDRRPRRAACHHPTLGRANEGVLSMFKAILLSQTEDKKTRAELLDLDESRLPDRDVTVAVEYSTLNYKDALAITGRGAVVRSWPLVPGIDLAGTVSQCRSADWKAGDTVVVTGWGLGENHWGGLAQQARLDAGWLLRIPGAVHHPHAR